MIRLRDSLRHVVLGLSLSVALVSPGFSQSPGDYQCGSGDDVRRIEIRFEDEKGQLPCRVIYRPEAANDAVGTVSWRGIDTLENCEAQARQVVDRLVGEGWTCATETEDGFTDVEQAAAIETLPVETADEAPEPQPLGPEPLDQESRAPEPLDNPDQQQAVVIEPTNLGAPMPELTALLKNDLQNLALTLDGNFKAEIVAYSDLNADDVDDALVLLTYNSPQPAYRQLLAAYLFDGERYQLTATRPIASSSSNTKNASIDEVDQGIIRISLAAFEPGDQSCCPSGVQQMTLALRNLDLVEIDENAPIR